MPRDDGIWMLRQHAPSWVLQGICSIILGVIACLLITASTVVTTFGHGDDDFSWLGYSADKATQISVILGSILLVFSAVTLILCTVEFILYRRQKLKPTILLISACIKLVMWLIYFVLVCIAASKGGPSVLDLILGIILLTTSLGQVLLGANYTIKHRRTGVGRGQYQDVEGGEPENMASIPRSKSWRASIPAITATSREFNAEDLSYESFRATMMEAEALRQDREAQALKQALQQESPEEPETQTLASSIYDESTATWTIASPPQSPSLGTELSHPPVTAYSDLHVYDFDQADLALTGFYGSSTTEGETRRR